MNSPGQHSTWHVDDAMLEHIAAAVGTPTYVYAAQDFRARYHALSAALAPLSHRLCYAVKANSNLSVLRLFKQLGAGFDIVSGGELHRVLEAGGDATATVFSGVGKRSDEIDYALKTGIGCFNVESASELARIEARAALLGRSAPVSIRVNPDVDAHTHPYIATGLKSSKFGVPAAEAMRLYAVAAASPALEVVGIDCHIGSQIETAEPLINAMRQLLGMVDELTSQGIAIRHLDLGGGLGVTYQHERSFDVAAYGQAIGQALAGRKLEVLLEPGRYLVAGGGLLLTRVEYLKQALEPDGHHFAVVDAAMNDLIRPPLYDAWHQIRRIDRHADALAAIERCWDVVGPVCESGDFLGKGRQLQLAEGALLGVCDAGAYGMVQSSNYNTRGRAAEVLVDQDQFKIVRRRETVRDLLRTEIEGLDAPPQPLT